MKWVFRSPHFRFSLEISLRDWWVGVLVQQDWSAIAPSGRVRNVWINPLPCISIVFSVEKPRP